MKKALVVAALALVAATAIAQSRYSYKVAHLSDNELAVACLNGKEPQSVVAGGVLIVSCR